jgi:hypothetical protein
VKTATVHGLDGTRSAARRRGNSRGTARVGAAVVEGKVGQSLVLGHRNLHRSGRKVPPNDFTARWSRHTAIIVVERLSLDKVVHVEHIETGANAFTLCPGERVGHRRGVGSHTAGYVGHSSHVRPSSEKGGKKRIVFRRGWIDHETDGGVVVCVGRLVHNVQLGAEKAAIDGVLGAGVDVELQSLVYSINAWDLERVERAGAIRGVCNLGTVVGETKGEIRYEARSGLRSCKKDEAKGVSVCFSCFSRSLETAAIMATITFGHPQR